MNNFVSRKFYNLCMRLQHEPLSIIYGFQVTDVNYRFACEALCKRYQKDRLLVSLYLDKVLLTFTNLFRKLHCINFH